MTSWEVQTTQAAAVPVLVSTSFLAPAAPVSTTSTSQQANLRPEPATETASPKALQTDQAPAPAESGDSSTLMIILCIVLTCGLACFAVLTLLFCVRFWALNLAAGKASKVKLPTASASQSSHPRATLHKTNREVSSGHPTLLVHAHMQKKHVQPKQAWIYPDNNRLSSQSRGLPTPLEVRKAVEVGHPGQLASGPAHKKYVQPQQALGHTAKHSSRSLAGTQTTAEFTLSALPCSSDKVSNVFDAKPTKYHRRALQESAVTAFAPVVLPTADEGAGTSGLGGHNLEEKSVEQVLHEASVCEAAVRSAFGLSAVPEEPMAVRSAFGLPVIQEAC